MYTNNAIHKDLEIDFPKVVHPSSNLDLHRQTQAQTHRQTWTHHAHITHAHAHHTHAHTTHTHAHTVHRLWMGFSGGFPRTMSAAFSASITVGAFVFPEVMSGMTLASITRRPSNPCTLRTDQHNSDASHARFIRPIHSFNAWRAPLGNWWSQASLDFCTFCVLSTSTGQNESFQTAQPGSRLSRSRWD